MDRYLVISIDVEPDCSLSWRYSDPLTFDGVHVGIKQRLHPLFNKYQMCPTYLINNVVLEDEKSIETFKSLKGEYEFGTHLHSEFIEPQKQFFDYAGKKGEANQCFLSPEIEFQKMKKITELFEKQFGKKPTSFRAGRFSAGKNTIKCLEKLGYKIDTSVTPHLNWKDKTRESPVDYRTAYEQPYFIKEGSYLEASDNGKILEVPVTITPINRFFLKKPTWLRPVSSSYKEFAKLIEIYSERYKQKDFIVFNLMFHNVEVLPSKSPYTKTEKDCSKYFEQLEQFFIYCNANNIKSIGLSSLHNIYNSRR